MPALTVIVPAYNEENNLGKTLHSIIEADYPIKQIIVVDDGSTDKTYTIASKYKRKPSSKIDIVL
jgi:glycosyltransferase involved in cell wall biosynthesis